MWFNYKLLLPFFLLLGLHQGFALQSKQADLKILTEHTKDQLKVYANNNELYPISVTFDFDIKGLKPLKEIPEILVLPSGKDSIELVTFSIPEGRSWSYKYSYRYYIGDANAKHKNDQEYLLPFEEGSQYLLSQGYFSNGTHRNERALDFTMPEGVNICAARSGKVVDLKEDSNKGCPSVDCNDYGNYIKILHDDGTMADYYHLKQNGALVEKGQKVRAGEVIGQAGATGWASGSHLHFIVYKASINGRISIPTKFKTKKSGTGALLEEGTWYRSIR